MEKGEKVVEKEKENRHLRVNGLNNKIVETAVEWSGSRANTESKFQRRQQMEMENEQAEYRRQWNQHYQEQDERRNDAQSQTSRHASGEMFSVGLVSDKGPEYGNRFVRINGLNATNPIRYLEGVLRVCYQEIPSQPDEFGCIRRNPKAEPNPLLCNLQDLESMHDTKEAVVEILHSMLNKISEYQIECSTIQDNRSHRITRFDLVETEVIEEESRQY